MAAANIASQSNSADNIAGPDASKAASIQTAGQIIAVTTAPTAIPTPTPAPDPTLQNGDENERVQNLQKGDILFFSTNGKKVGHPGIYIGNGEMIDASSSNGKVVKRSCVSSFWKANFVVARRPL